MSRDASLAPILAEILDQFGRQGPLTPEEFDTVPRDRDGSVEPRLIGKHERRFTGFDDKVVTDARMDAAVPMDAKNAPTRIIDIVKGRPFPLPPHPFPPAPRPCRTAAR